MQKPVTGLVRTSIVGMGKVLATGAAMLLLGCAPPVSRAPEAARGQSERAGLQAELLRQIPEARGLLSEDRVVTLRDCSTGEPCCVYLVWGGPTYLAKGYAALLDEQHRLLEKLELPGLYKSGPTATILAHSADDQSIELRCRTRSGTGLSDEQIVLLSVVKRKLTVIWQGKGDLYEWAPEGTTQRLGLVGFIEDASARPVLVHMTYQSGPSGQPQVRCDKYLFDPAKCRFVATQ